MRLWIAVETTMNSKYDDFGDSNGGNNGDDDENEGYASTLKTTPFIKISGQFSHVVQGSSDNGQSIGVVYDEGRLYDGILTTRTDKDELKVFSWNEAPIIEDETLSTGDLPPVITKTYGGETYKYEILAARLEADPDVGYEADAMVRGVSYDLGDDEEVPDAPESGEPINLDLVQNDDAGNPDARYAIWESSTSNGPTSSAKTTAKVLTEQGVDSVLADDEKFDWLDSDVRLRPELEGMRVNYVKVARESNSSDNTFHQAVWVDPATGEQLMPPENGGGNGTSADSGSESKQAAADGGAAKTAPEGEAETDDAEGGADGAGEALAEFEETCNDLGISDQTALDGLLEDVIADDDYAVTEDNRAECEDLIAELAE